MKKRIFVAGLLRLFLVAAVLLVSCNGQDEGQTAHSHTFGE